MPLYEYMGVRPTIGRDVYIAPTASIIGDVTIGDGASIWFNTVLRGDVMPISIGARTNIQDGSVVHVTNGIARTTIGDDVTVGHMVLLHGCTVGNTVLVGMGSVLLDGSVVEDGAIVGAGALLPPGMRVAAGTLVMGRPAKVIRPVSDMDRGWILGAGAAYIEASRIFRSDAVKRID